MSTPVYKSSSLSFIPRQQPLSSSPSKKNTSATELKAKKDTIRIEEYKLAVVGSGGVGKSAITCMFVQNVFVEDYDPTIEDSYRKYQRVDDQTYMLNILDSSGQEEYASLRDQHYRSADGFILVFALNSQKTFDEVDSIHERICAVKDTDRVPLVLCGNKCDLVHERVVAPDAAVSLKNRLSVPYFETSAKNKHNVEEAFSELVRTMKKHFTPVHSNTKNAKKPCSIL